MNPKLFKNQPGIMPAKGLLKWRDFIAAIKALKSAGQITVDGAKITQTPTGVVIQNPIYREVGSTPFDAVPVATSGGVNVRITPGFIFGGASFVMPTIYGLNIASPSARVIPSAPSKIYAKITWRPVIALDNDFVTYEGDDIEIALYRCPQGIDLISAEIVWTDAASPSAAGWTASGDSHVYAKVRELHEVDGSKTASVSESGQHYELIAQRNTEWTEGDDIADLYLSSQESIGGGYGHRAIRDASYFRETAIETDPEVTRIRDIEFRLTIGGVSII